MRVCPFHRPVVDVAAVEFHPVTAVPKALKRLRDSSAATAEVQYAFGAVKRQPSTLEHRHELSCRSLATRDVVIHGCPGADCEPERHRRNGPCVTCAAPVATHNQR